MLTWELGLCLWELWTVQQSTQTQIVHIFSDDRISIKSNLDPDPFSNLSLLENSGSNLVGVNHVMWWLIHKLHSIPTTLHPTFTSVIHGTDWAHLIKGVPSMEVSISIPSMVNQINNHSLLVGVFQWLKKHHCLSSNRGIPRRLLLTSLMKCFPLFNVHRSGRLLQCSLVCRSGKLQVMAKKRRKASNFKVHR